MPSDLERRLARALTPRAEPDPGLEERMRAAALGALSPRSPSVWARRALRRRLGPLALAGALIIGGSALAAVALRATSGSGADPRYAALVSATANENLERTPTLADAPWLAGTHGPEGIREAIPRPSLVFPPGVGYPEATQRFYDAVSQRGELPSDTHLGPPLPLGTVVSLPVDRTRGVAISLVAPFGWVSRRGTILPPGFRAIPDGAAYPRGDVGLKLPLGARIVPPRLRSCQVMHGDRVSVRCPLGIAPVGAPSGRSGVVGVPDLRGMRLGAALVRLGGSGMQFDDPEGWFNAYSPEAIAKAVDRGWVAATVTRGYPSVDRLPTEGFRLFPQGGPGPHGEGLPALRLMPGAHVPLGTVVAQYPQPGLRVPKGTRLLFAVAADDCLPGDPRRGADCIPGAEQRRLRSPLLARLPWLLPGTLEAQALRPYPSLVFPSGTTYLGALRSLYVAVMGHGRLPGHTTLGPPLPRGTVFAPGRSGHRPALDVGLAWGYDATSGSVNGVAGDGIIGADPVVIARRVRAGRIALLPLLFSYTDLERPALPGCEVLGADARGNPCPAFTSKTP